MARTLHLNDVTPSGQTFTDEAVSIRAPGERGYVGILYNHAPLVSVLTSGKLSWRRPGGVARTTRIGAGLLEVTKNHVTILTDALEELSAPPAH